MADMVRVLEDWARISSFGCHRMLVRGLDAWQLSVTLAEISVSYSFGAFHDTVLVRLRAAALEPDRVGVQRRSIPPRIRHGIGRRPVGLADRGS